jgi:hypothetical protein
MSDDPDPREFIEPWWETAPKEVEPGQLVRIALPSPDFISMGLVVEGRKDPREHGKAAFYTNTLERVLADRRELRLPVAGMPSGPWIVQRAKVRYALVLSRPGSAVPKGLGGSAALREPCLLVVPYWTADQSGGRQGLRPELVSKIKRAFYPQFLADQLPIERASDVSVVRFDHVYAVGASSTNFEVQPHRLSSDALAFVQGWFAWAQSGTPPALAEHREIIEACRDWD